MKFHASTMAMPDLRIDDDHPDESENQEMMFALEPEKSLLDSLEFPGKEPFGPEGDEPIYVLPVKVIDSLAGPNERRGIRWLSRSRTEAERRYSQQCELQNCVGFQSQYPIPYPQLNDKSVEVTDPLLASMGWTAAQIQAVQDAVKQTSDTTGRLCGVAGWLLTEPAFLQEVNHVRKLYHRIPRASRPRFPLGRILAASGSTSEAESLFGHALRKLLDRWGLMSLTTWGLPSPQGPWVPDDLPPGAPARPTHGIHVYIPLHYPLKGDDALQAKIKKYQQQAATELGIDRSFAGPTHYEAYRQMFCILHLERAILQRFPEKPRGLMDTMNTAMAEETLLKIESVKRLRKFVTKCRLGKRQQIKELRVKN